MGFPGDHIDGGVQKEIGLGSAVWGSQSIAPSDLPLPTLAEPAQTSAVSTLPPCSGRPGSLGEGLKATQTQPAKRLGPGSQGKGRGKGWPSEPVGKSPVLGTVPTHLARDIVARTAGRGVLGRLSIPGGSGARHARHVPWTRGRGADTQGEAGHVNTDAEIRVVYLRANKWRASPGATRSWRRQRRPPASRPPEPSEGF